MQPHSPLQALAPKPHAFWGRLSVSQTADWKDMESPIRKGGFIVPWEPSAKGTPQFSLESSLHHPTCCRPSRLSHPLGEGLGPRGQTFHVMLLKATPLWVPHRRASLPAEAALRGYGGRDMYRHTLAALSHPKEHAQIKRSHPGRRGCKQR